MENVFARSGEKAINLFHKHLLRTQLTLAIFYIVVMAVMLGLSGEITHRVFTERISQKFQEINEQLPRRELPTAKTVRKELKETMLIVNGILLALAGIMGYLLAGITLEPLKKSYEKEQQFLSNVSHELRTPLTILRTSLENLKTKTGILHTKEIEESIEEVDRMHNLMQNLLTLSRGESHALEQKKISLNQLAKNTTERMRIFAKKHHQKIILKENSEEMMVEGNEPALEQALTNVIENAIVYNSRQGTVHIGITKKNNRVQVTITDTGIGMSKEDATRSTERFYRAEKSRNRAQGGSGIGLALVNEIVKAHRGNLKIHSEPGKGTTVTLSFPVHKAS
jgi:two-component system, OmpR family, sensor histidine kinase CiaH